MRIVWHSNQVATVSGLRDHEHRAIAVVPVFRPRKVSETDVLMPIEAGLMESWLELIPVEWVQVGEPTDSWLPKDPAPTSETRIRGPQW